MAGTDDDVRRLSTTLRDALVSVQWSRVDSGPNPERRCPSCGATKGIGHRFDCRVGAALREADDVLGRVPAPVRSRADTSILPPWARTPVKLAIWSLWTFEAAIGLSGVRLPHGAEIVPLIASCVALAFYRTIVGHGPESRTNEERP